MNYLKNTIKLVGIFSAGVAISGTFVLSSNDIFYRFVLRKLFVEKNSKEAWEEIKPRELVGQGAKKTFIKHKIAEDRNDDTTRYYEYVDKRKNILNGGVDDDKIIFENIYDKSKSK